MALKLVINISKKIPGPQDYSSVQAACTLEGELAQGQDPATEAARLYAQAEAAVDAQLGLQSSSSWTNHAPFQPIAAPTAQATPRATPVPAPSGSGRRGPSRATPSQLQLLQRLIGSNQPQSVAICQHYGTPDLATLSVRQASEVIDELKSRTP